ncbi:MULTISPECIES: SdpI family protein [unclassified Haladaptatus]|uniref:SdpI family protein n=1 Tax=unclassified Haladaptatus TaxID=2622732 RepID=UPI00209C2F84|nr:MULTISPECIES: SdpI family protein [unclassified Haladaptatus]MCO8246003.1 SdpI family protein [Haladaptatus sp. AB643]MCO8254377.1 SdpI family protein [Haladaptatus sp. AB618]
MKGRKSYFVALALVVVSFALGVYYYPRMPDQIASHWNASGNADGTMPKLWGLFLVPTMTAGLFVLFAAIPRIDPLRENIAEFRRYYDLFIVLFVAFMLYMQVLIVLWNLGYRFDFTMVLSPAIGVLYYFIGALMSRVERNWFIGVRTPWTLSDDRVWKKTHSRAGPLFKIAGIIAILGAFVPRYAIYLMVGPVILVAAYLMLYSYVEYRRVAA